MVVTSQSDTATYLHSLQGRSRAEFYSRIFDSNVIWLGDMNYRIDLENGAVRYLAESDEFDALVAADQVRS